MYLWDMIFFSFSSDIFHIFFIRNLFFIIFIFLNYQMKWSRMRFLFLENHEFYLNVDPIEKSEKMKSMIKIKKNKNELYSPIEILNYSEVLILQWFQIWVLWSIVFLHHHSPHLNVLTLQLKSGNEYHFQNHFISSWSPIW